MTIGVMRMRRGLATATTVTRSWQPCVRSRRGVALVSVLAAGQQRADGVGGDEAGGEGVDADAVGAEFAGERTRDADDRRFGGNVVGQAGRSREGDLGGEIDDRAAFGLAE